MVVLPFSRYRKWHSAQAAPRIVVQENRAYRLTGEFAIRTNVCGLNPIW